MKIAYQRSGKCDTGQIGGIAYTKRHNAIFLLFMFKNSMLIVFLVISLKKQGAWPPVLAQSVSGPT
jgi:hypothetical protein